MKAVQYSCSWFKLCQGTNNLKISGIWVTCGLILFTLVEQIWKISSLTACLALGLVSAGCLRQGSQAPPRVSCVSSVCGSCHKPQVVEFSHRNWVLEQEIMTSNSSSCQGCLTEETAHCWPSAFHGFSVLHECVTHMDHGQHGFQTWPKRQKKFKKLVSGNIFFTSLVSANHVISFLDFLFSANTFFPEERKWKCSFILLNKHNIKGMMLSGHSKIKSSFTFY